MFNWQECLPTGNRGQRNKYTIREKPNSLTMSLLQAIKGFETLFAPEDIKILEERNIFVPLVSFVCKFLRIQQILNDPGLIRS